MGGLRRGLTEPTSLNLLDGGSADPIRDCIRTLTPSTSLSQLQNLTATVVLRRSSQNQTAGQGRGYGARYEHDEALVAQRAVMARKAFVRHNKAKSSKSRLLRSSNSSLTRLNELAAPVAQSVAKGVRSVSRLSKGRSDFFRHELRGAMGARLILFFPILIAALYVACSAGAVALPFFLNSALTALGRGVFGGGGQVQYAYGKNPLALGLTSSASKLEAVKLSGGKDADMEAIAFLDAVEDVKPVYESLGFMFSIASREVTSNVDKLRVHVKRYGAERRPSLHDLVESDIAAGQQWHKDGAFEALRWLSFGLKFMESVFTCVGEGESDPSVCAQAAYDCALKPVHGPALQHLSKSLLKIVPVSPGMIISKLEVADDEARLMMARWGKAIQRPREAIEEWYKQWPPPRA